jgi:hypothetical protein
MQKSKVKSMMKMQPKSMKRLYFVIPVLVIVVISGVLLTNKYVTAQVAGQGLEVSPPSQDVSIDPGGTTTVTAKLRNPSSNTLPITVHIEDFTAKGDQGQVELTANSPYSVASWTKVSPAKFELAPGESQEVTATIKAPADAAGGHFGSFVFSVQPDSPNGNAATVSQEIASLFLVKVSGPVDEKLVIKDFTAPSFSEFGPVDLSVNFSNTGNVYVKAFGLVNVTDMFGHKVADIVVPGTNIFPNADRIVKAHLKNQFLFGNYSATAIMYYGAQNQTLTATTSFFVFPVRIAAIVIVILFILFLMRKRLKKASRALFK